MTRSLLFFLFAAIAIWYVIRARRTNCPPRYLLAAFWGFMALNQPPRTWLLFVAAFLSLGGYWVWISVWRKNSIRDIQKMLGITDAEMAESEAAGRRAEERKREEAARKKEVELHEEAARTRATLRRVRVDAVQPAEQGFPVEGSGSLLSMPGPVSAELELESFEWDEGIVAYRCRTFVCDSEGTEWRCETFGRAGNFLSALDDPDTREFPSWEKAPAAWVEAIKSQCVLAGLKELLDSRDYHEVDVDGRRFEYMEKYQMPTVDVAWLAEKNSWIVRVKGIYRDVHGKDEDLDEMPNIPPFVLTAPAETGLLLVEPEMHACDPEEWLDDERRRPIFSKTGRRGVPQATVVYSSDPLAAGGE